MLLLLTGLLAAAALLPLWLESRRDRAPALLTGCAALFVVAICFAASGHPPAAVPPPDRPQQEPHGDYIGSAACRACHADEHASWHGSFHRTMTQVATRTALIPQFDRLELDWFGERIELAWRSSGELWVELPDPSQPGRRLLRPVVQLTGSHHFQVLWYSTGQQRELGMVPLVWRIDVARWMPIGAAFLLPPEFQQPLPHGTWNRNCHMCHATAVEPRLDTGRVQTRAAEFGIGCEACHGPGGPHAAANRSPLRRYALHLGGAADDTIVDPKDLDPQRSSQVCGQCHAVSIERLANFDRWREQGLAYRPGQDLHQSRLVLDPDQADAPELRGRLREDPDFFDHTFWRDGTVRVSGREYNGLLRSPCHVRGSGQRTMTCLSCHDLHRRDDRIPLEQWRDDQLAAGMAHNTACTQCHPELATPDGLVAHTHHAAGSVGSACYNCHMSHTSYGLLKAVRSHTIESPSVQTELATGRPNACNQCHLDRTLAWTNAHLRDKWGIEPAALDADQTAVAASVRWLLSGDAGQRALAAWSLGWEPARTASGTDWMAPYLGQLLADPYYAVRFLAWRSLRSLPAGAPDGYDFLGDRERANQAVGAVQAAWEAGWRQGAATGERSRPELMLQPAGLDWGGFRRLLARRDDRKIFLAE